MCVSPQRRAIFRHQNFKKCSKTWGVLYILTCKCAFRHSGLQFFDISTSKSAPKHEVFCYILTCEMCVSPQRRAIFRHLNFKKCSEHEVFCTFWLAKYAFRHSGVQFFDISTSKSAPRPDMFCSILTSKCAFRHSGVQFLISLLQHANLRTRRFNRPTFRLTWHTNHWKNTACGDFSNISRGYIFFLLTFWLLHLLSTDLTTLLLCFSSAFQLSILSEVSI